MFNPDDFPAPTMIAVNGVTLEVFEAGGGQNTQPIILCHGWPEHAFSWRYQIAPLVDAGYHVIVPNQRGYGHSSAPSAVTDYDINCLTGDMVGLLDHFGYQDAVFMGHDWGAMVVWGMAMLHPDRVKGVINLALPYQERGVMPWIEMMEQFLGPEYYFVHFNRQPGVADKVLDAHAGQFLRNLFRKNIPVTAPEAGMVMINLARAEVPMGDPVMDEAELNVYVQAFKKTGFTASINWYRNLDRNWHILADVDPVIRHPALMIYGERDMIPKFDRITDYVPNIEVTSIDCGHWINQECPEATNQLVVNWLTKQVF